MCGPAIQARPYRLSKPCESRPRPGARENTKTSAQKLVEPHCRTSPFFKASPRSFPLVAKKKKTSMFRHTLEGCVECRFWSASLQAHRHFCPPAGGGWPIKRLIVHAACTLGARAFFLLHLLHPPLRGQSCTTKTRNKPSIPWALSLRRFFLFSVSVSLSLAYLITGFKLRPAPVLSFP